jgi:hypothetical protein
MLKHQVTSPATCKNCLSVGFSATVNTQYRFCKSVFALAHCFTTYSVKILCFMLLLIKWIAIFPKYNNYVCLSIFGSWFTNILIQS